ncbi:MAG: hypothetical protein L3J23_08205 [Flavobacteriaceae bacterium]|nr:hypothetical protein [Flavobacteriaceae bacterium]
MKKNITTLIFTIVFSIISFAQVPELMSFQAVIRDADSKLVSDQNVGIKVSILEATSSGNPIYVERHQRSTNINGLVNLEIGSGIVEVGEFSAIDWSVASYYIKTETDIEGGTNYDIVAVSQLLSVPYALHAKTVATTSAEGPWRNEDGTPATNTSTNINYNGDVEVTGSIQLGVINGIAAGAECDSGDVGKIIFNGSNFCACDGAVWIQVD